MKPIIPTGYKVAFLSVALVYLIIDGCGAEQSTNPEDSLYEYYDNAVVQFGYKGIVKSVKLEEANKHELEVDERILTSFMEFNIEGFLTKSITYDIDGKVNYRIENNFKFDSKGFTKESKYFSDFDEKENIHGIEVYNKKGLLKTVTSYRGDTLSMNIHFKYDTLGNVIKTYDSTEGVSFIEITKYKYDNKGNMLLKELYHRENNTFQMEGIEDSEDTTQEDFKYDDEGRCIYYELSYNGKHDKVVIEYHYNKNGRLEWMTSYGRMNHKSVSFLDKIGNVIRDSIFLADGRLDYVLKYKYKYDKQKNWTQKEDWRYYSEEGKFIRFGTHYRKFRYY